MQQVIPGNDYADMAEVFSDVFEIHVNPWSAAITFGVRATREGENNKFTHRARMPLSQAKALAVLMLKEIRAYEDIAGVEVELPKPLLDELQIAPRRLETIYG